MKLSAKHKRFADEYLIDLNGTAAYMRAGYKAVGEVAKINASRLLARPDVKEYVEKRIKDREKRTEITQDKVLELWWKIATADPNEIIYHRRVCCRYCFGRGHEYQWKDEGEYADAWNAAIKMDLPVPNDDGGFGFDHTLRPHPKCPECHGEGHPNIQATDTRDLSEQARLLYSGVKTTKDGFEIKMRDQDKALENVARHLGMFTDNVKVTANNTNNNLNTDLTNLSPEERRARIDELVRLRGS